jgi:hypothetical protein
MTVGMLELALDAWKAPVGTEAAAAAELAQPPLPAPLDVVEVELLVLQEWPEVKLLVDDEDEAEEDAEEEEEVPAPNNSFKEAVNALPAAVAAEFELSTSDRISSSALTGESLTLGGDNGVNRSKSYKDRSMSPNISSFSRPEVSWFSWWRWDRLRPREALVVVVTVELGSMCNCEAVIDDWETTFDASDELISSANTLRFDWWLLWRWWSLSEDSFVVDESRKEDDDGFGSESVALKFNTEVQLRATRSVEVVGENEDDDDDEVVIGEADEEDDEEAEVSGGVVFVWFESRMNGVSRPDDVPSRSRYKYKNLSASSIGSTSEVCRGEDMDDAVDDDDEGGGDGEGEDCISSSPSNEAESSAAERHSSDGKLLLLLLLLLKPEVDVNPEHVLGEAKSHVAEQVGNCACVEPPVWVRAPVEFELVGGVEGAAQLANVIRNASRSNWRSNRRKVLQMSTERNKLASLLHRNLFSLVMLRLNKRCRSSCNTWCGGSLPRRPEVKQERSKWLSPTVSTFDSLLGEGGAADDKVDDDCDDGADMNGDEDNSDADDGDEGEDDEGDSRRHCSWRASDNWPEVIASETSALRSDSRKAADRSVAEGAGAVDDIVGVPQLKRDALEPFKVVGVRGNEELAEVFKEDEEAEEPNDTLGVNVLIGALEGKPANEGRIAFSFSSSLSSEANWREGEQTIGKYGEEWPEVWPEVSAQSHLQCTLQGWLTSESGSSDSGDLRLRQREGRGDGGNMAIDPTTREAHENQGRKH